LVLQVVAADGLRLAAPVCHIDRRGVGHVAMVVEPPLAVGPVGAMPT
jgi:hypothetical protein